MKGKVTLEQFHFQCVYFGIGVLNILHTKYSESHGFNSEDFDVEYFLTITFTHEFQCGFKDLLNQKKM